MNIEDARKIIADHEAGKCEECFEGACMDEAKGFIQGYESGRREALESEAVKGLGKALEYIQTNTREIETEVRCECALSRFEQFKKEGKS